MPRKNSREIPRIIPEENPREKSRGIPWSIPRRFFLIFREISWEFFKGSVGGILETNFKENYRRHFKS